MNPRFLMCSFLAIVLVGNPANCQECDFDGDGDCDVDDIDLFTWTDLRFDLTEDGVVDLSDRDLWLSLAGTENGFAGPMLGGDANLDGIVNVLDLNRIGLHWQSSGTVWSQGDFDFNGQVDAGDLMQLGINWQQSVPKAVVAVPEPTDYLLGMLIAIGLVRIIRRHPAAVLALMVLVGMRR